MIESRDITQSGEYWANWSSPNGQVSGAVYVKVGCPEHGSVHPYCVRLGTICYPPMEFRLTGKIER